MAERVAGVEDLPRVLGRVVAADQRFGQAIGVVDIVEPEAALDAKSVLVGGPVQPVHIQQFAVAYVKGELAPDAAVGTRAESTVFSGAPVWTPSVSRTLAGISAPVGQACTHSPQATQVLSPMGSSISKTMRARWLRLAMPMTSFTCTSRQARTQSVQWIQASRLTAMAGWLESAGGRSWAGNRLSVKPASRTQWKNSDSRIVRDPRFRLVGQQQLKNHVPRFGGPLGVRRHGHAGRRLADAGRRQRAFAVDFDHACPAVAVRPVTRLVAVTEVGQGVAATLGHLPDGFAGVGLDVFAIEGEPDRVRHGTSSSKNRSALSTGLVAA